MDTAVRPLFLIGFMASGKTTLGRALPGYIPGAVFVDLDSAVEERMGMAVKDIFATMGEEVFRRAEEETLRSVARPGAIVACGGGTPCRAGAMDFMLSQGTVVWLRASVPTTVRRLLEAPAGKRPLVEPFRGDTAALEAFVRAKEAERTVHYSRAHATFASDRLENAAEIDDSCRRFVADMPLT